MSTRDDEGRRTLYMMRSADLLAEVGERVMVRLLGVEPGVIAQLDLNSPEEVESFIAYLRKTAKLAWPGEEQ